MRRALEFAGHENAGNLALQLQRMLRHPVQDAAASYALFEAGDGLAGANVRGEDDGNSARRVTLFNVWHAGEPHYLYELASELLARHHHEVAFVPLYLLPEERCRELAAVLAPLGFVRDRYHTLRFDLTEVPPLGSPLVLEAYREEDERAFKDAYRSAEGERPSDARWAYLKRKGGPFSPDLWFLARETLDQRAVGYAFCSATKRGVDASYVLDGAGVLGELRSDSDMLRRLLISLLHELAMRAPMGTVEAELPSGDPKLVQILVSLGFVEVEVTPTLVKLPA